MNRIVFLVLVLCACKGSQSGQPSEVSLKETAEKYIGADHEIIERGAYALIVSRQEIGAPTRTKFVVVSLTNSDIIYGPEMLLGLVSWHSDEALLLAGRPEQIQDKNGTEDFRKILNIRTGQKRAFSQSPKQKIK